MLTKVVQVEYNSKIYFDFVEAQPTFAEGKTTHKTIGNKRFVQKVKILVLFVKSSSCKKAVILQRRK
jgi:hypothetical protein